MSKKDSVEYTHEVEVIINETVTPASDDGKPTAQIRVQHARKIIGEEGVETIEQSPEDLMELMANLLISSILNRKCSGEEKMVVAIAVSRGLIASIAAEVEGVNDEGSQHVILMCSDDAVSGDPAEGLTAEQKEALAHTLASGSFKSTVN